MYGIDLKEVRKSRGMTQEQVGILAGMSKSQVCRMENGTLGSPELLGVTRQILSDVKTR